MAYEVLAELGGIVQVIKEVFPHLSEIGKASLLREGCEKGLWDMSLYSHFGRKYAYAATRGIFQVELAKIGSDAGENAVSACAALEYFLK